MTCLLAAMQCGCNRKNADYSKYMGSIGHLFLINKAPLPLAYYIFNSSGMKRYTASKHATSKQE